MHDAATHTFTIIPENDLDSFVCRIYDYYRHERFVIPSLADSVEQAPLVAGIPMAQTRVIG